MLKGGVIGFGNIGQQLTRHVGAAWQGRARIVAACNRGPENLAVARDRFGLAVTRDPAELLAMGLDFVLVTSTSAAHAAQVEAAARRGLAVFCEKPIALTLEDADRAIAAAERAGVVTVVNYSLRFIEASRTIRELARSGELGRILAVHHLRTRGYGLYEAGARHRAVTEADESGGWIVHHACHDIDLLSWVHGPDRPGVRAHHDHRARRRERGAGAGDGGFRRRRGGLDRRLGLQDPRARDARRRQPGFARDERRGRQHRAAAPPGGRRPARDHPGARREAARRRAGPFPRLRLAGRPSPDSLASARHSLAVALAMRESARTGRPVDVPPENPPATP